ncbi:MAG: WbqC family protein [Bacteroidota bacterium]
MPPAAYFAGATDRFFSINTHERFIKQNLRTRCHILSPNGIITLVVPVAHQELNNSLVKDVRISHKENWQRRHFRTIKTCYGRSPYFEFFEEELAKFYDLRLEFLWEFNLASVRFLSDSMGLSAHFNVVEKENMETPYAYLSNYSSPDQLIQQPSYMQVFRDRYPFVSGLSALDLLMNLGQASVSYLNSMGFQTQPKK